MKILCIDPSSATLDWSMRCIADGHKVKWVTSGDKLAQVGRGIVEIVDSPWNWLKWPDLVFYADNTKWTQLVSLFRAAGVIVIGADEPAAAWELDRGVGQGVLRKAGVTIAPYKDFTDYDTAIAYVKREMKRFVSKPSGDADKALSYCAKSPADMVYMLERWKKTSKLKTPFILQEFIPGIEMAVGAWIGRNGFRGPWCENWEFKKLMDGDMGVATGEQGTVVRYTTKSKLADKVLKPVEEACVALGYCGYVDVNCIIDDKGTPWPLEFTMRPGWPTFNIQQALHSGDHAEWLVSLYEGHRLTNWNTVDVAIGVVMSIPDYPYSKITRKEVTGIPLYGMKPSMQAFIHPCEMQAGEAPHEENGKVVSKPCLVTAGDYVLVCSATNVTVRAAKQLCYSRLKKLSMPNSPMYRTDIGDRLAKQLPQLQTMGYATGLLY